MCIDNEIINAINFYQVLKKDLHTLLIKSSKTPLDYEGTLTEEGHIEYQIHEEHRDREMHRALINAGILLESMLKNDVRLWDKTQGIENIESIEVAPDHRCETIVLEVRFQK